jgi:hypothetical protein
VRLALKCLGGFGGLIGLGGGPQRECRRELGGRIFTLGELFGSVPGDVPGGVLGDVLGILGGVDVTGGVEVFVEGVGPVCGATGAPIRQR